MCPILATILPDIDTNILTTFGRLLTEHRKLLFGAAIQQAVEDNGIWLDSCRTAICIVEGWKELVPWIHSKVVGQTGEVITNQT